MLSLAQMVRGLLLFLSLSILCLCVWDIYENWSLYQTAYYMRPLNQRRTTVEPTVQHQHVIVSCTSEPERILQQWKALCTTTPLHVYTTKPAPADMSSLVTWHTLHEYPLSLWQLLLDVPAHRVFFVSDTSYLVADPFQNETMARKTGSYFWPLPQIPGADGTAATPTWSYNLNAFLFDRVTHFSALEVVLWCLQNTPGAVLDDHTICQLLLVDLKEHVYFGRWGLVDERYQCFELHGKPLVVTLIPEQSEKGWVLTHPVTTTTTTTTTTTPEGSYGVVLQHIPSLKVTRVLEKQTGRNQSLYAQKIKDRYHLLAADERMEEITTCQLAYRS
jgi:hypothetical protein